MENKIYITDENGNEVSMEILFTFETDDKKYVIVHDEDADDYYPFSYDEQGNLEAIENEEEFEMILEVFNSFDGGIEDEEDI